MKHLFLTQPSITSPRWQQAFPNADVVFDRAQLPLFMSNTMVWVVLAQYEEPEDYAYWTSEGARVVVLTLAEDPRQARRAVECGASGYLHFLANSELLKQVAQVIEMGGLWLGADLMRQLVFATASILSESKMESPSLEQLTLREKAVADAVALGKTNKEVARELSITERTVKAHLGAVFEKLGVRDRLQLVLVMSGK